MEVLKPAEPTEPKNLFEEMGGMPTMKLIAYQLTNNMKAHPKLTHFFHYSQVQMHFKRLSHYFAFLTGGEEEWIGRSLEDAHRGRFITAEHFRIFIEILQQTLIDVKIPEILHERFIFLLQDMRNSVVIQSEQCLGYYEQLNFKSKFDLILSNFLTLLAKDDHFEEYFTKNMMIRHMIHSIITVFFSKTFCG